MGRILYMTLQGKEGILGIGEEVTEVKLWVEISNPELIREGTDLIVSIHLIINTMGKEVVITKRISSEQIVGEDEKRLPIEGSLWVPGSPSEVQIESQSVELYYFPV